MKKLILILSFAITSLTINAQQNFGGPVNKTEVKNATEIPGLLKSQTEINNITITGNIDAVCQAKGCWLTMSVGSEKMTVKFKDYAFFMPKDCSGKKATMTGKAFMKEVSVEEQKHLAKDAGKSKKEIKKIKAPITEYYFEASGVELEG